MKQNTENKTNSYLPWNLWTIKVAQTTDLQLCIAAILGFIHRHHKNHKAVPVVNFNSLHGKLHTDVCDA